MEPSRRNAKQRDYYKKAICRQSRNAIVEFPRELVFNGA